jgi:BCCT family betaine/carnitine transporter
VTGKLDSVAIYEATGDLYITIIEILKQLPLSALVMVALVVAMIAFYATSFDSITLVAAQYSYKDLREDEEPKDVIKAFWSVMLILLPVALVFSESSMANIQSVSIIAAFPIGLVIVLITAAFMKDARVFLAELSGECVEVTETTAEEISVNKAFAFKEDDDLSDEKIEEIIGNWEYIYGDR